MTKIIFKLGLSIGFWLVVVLLPLPVSAHPHLFADYSVRLTKADDQSLVLDFDFDFSGQLQTQVTVRSHVVGMPELDTQNNITKAADILPQLAMHPILLDLVVDGEKLGLKKLDLISSSDQPDGAHYRADLHLPEGVKDFSFILYDSEYYVAITHRGDVSKVAAENLNLHCLVNQVTIGKTMWGNNNTQQVACALGKSPLIPAHVEPKNTASPALGPFGKDDFP